MAFETLEHPGQRAFLGAYAQLGNVKRAAKIAGISREAHYDWLRTPEYAASFAIAKVMAGEALEDEAHDRAVRGSSDYVLFMGEVVMHQGKPLKKRRYSDALLTLLLKGNLPEKYKERSATELSGPNGQAIRHQHTKLDYSRFSDEDLKTLERLARKAALPAGHPDGDGDARALPPASEN